MSVLDSIGYLWPVLDTKMKFKWARLGGYEVTTQGDRRFSAFNAIMQDGRSIEQIYQADVKFYDPGGVNWRLGKGKPPLRKISRAQLYDEYKALWRDWCQAHPDLLHELYEIAQAHGCILSDRFATSEINQAHALSDILNEYHEFLLT